MTSKGVNHYTYASGPQFSVKIGAPKVDVTRGQADNFSRGSLQIDSSNIPGLLNYVGVLSWHALAGGVPIGAGNESINSFWGKTEGGTMSDMMRTPSSVGPDYALSYGFYDAGSGIGTGLPDHEQLYVYLTDNHSAWMGDLVAAHPDLKDAPLARFALPGAHDAGTFYLGTVNGMLPSGYAKALLEALGLVSTLGALAYLTAAQAPRVITNLAVTQKDDVATMLDLGVRYFDFRPGYLYGALRAYSPDMLYHQHSVIPGYPYLLFLQDLLLWLARHPSEIVVVSANAQGPLSEDMRPSEQVLDNHLATVLQNTGLADVVRVGGKESFGSTYAELLESKTRLIIVDKMGTDNIQKYDSYSGHGDDYATVSPDSILEALGTMNAQGQAGNDYTVLQIQGTATSLIGNVDIPAIATESDAYSPLMATKASFDAATNPWLLANVSKNLSPDQLVVFLNDFVDNLTVSTAITVTMQRMGLL